MKQLSIIIPVYKVEQYIRPCIESIYRQELNEDIFEVIIINDGTPDNSMDMISDLIAQHQNIVVINQENKGMSIARNNGLKIATGDYIAFLDSDDVWINNCIKPLLLIASNYQPDMIIGDYIRLDDKDILSYKHPVEKLYNKDISLTCGKDLFLTDLSPHECFVWRNLYKRTFLEDNNIHFIPGIFFEDIPFIHNCYIKAKKCIRIHWLIYIYRLWGHSTTNSLNAGKTRDYCTAIYKTWELNQTDGIDPSIYNKLKNNVLAQVSTVLYSISKYIKNYNEASSAIMHVKQILPLLPLNNGMKPRMLRFFINRTPFTYLFIRRMYGIIIEDHIRPFLRSKKCLLK